MESAFALHHALPAWRGGLLMNPRLQKREHEVLPLPEAVRPLTGFGAGSNDQRNTSRSLSAGVQKPKVLRGLWFNSKATASSCSWENLDKSTPFGKY